MIKEIAVAAVLAVTPVSTGSTDRPADSGPVGFAAGTTGGSAGTTVRATTLEQLRGYAAAPEPLVVEVDGSIRVDPFGDMIRVASDKTIVGAGPGAELVGGGLLLNGTHNVIIRNLTIRDSYIPGDFDGKNADYDNDGIRLDTAHHVWIDHNRIERTGDGGIDIRKDSDNITLSWNIISDINKAMGVGWTSNVVTRVTAHHNWIRNTVQRNWSLDNTAAAHLYNNYLENITQYGTMVRNNAHAIVEESVFEQVNDPLVRNNNTGVMAQRNNLLIGTRGRVESSSDDFTVPYPYTPDPARTVKQRVTRYAGPDRTPHRTPNTITVALDGSGDYGSLLAALGATRDARGPVTIKIAPGYYREQVRVFPSQSNVTITGPADAEITYDLNAAGQKFYGGPLGDDAATFTLLGTGTTVRGLAVTGTAAPAVRAAGDRAILDGTRITGFLAGHGRSYLGDCTVDGAGDLITGPAVAVLDRCTINPTTGASATAASTPARQPYGILINRSVIDGGADPGTVLLGRSGQVVIRESVLGPQVAAAPWTAGDGRFGEYANTGPGSGRPELTKAEARRFTVTAYLGGWRPRT
jgi:pectate lyase